MALNMNKYHLDHECGILYIVTTHSSYKYIASAVESARSAKLTNSDIPAHIYTDDGGLHYLDALGNKSPFQTGGLIRAPHYRSKVDYLASTPFKRTLYLDSDTRVVGNISNLFLLLDRFDFCGAHAHARNRPAAAQVWNKEIPEGFPQINGGVLLYRDSDVVKCVLNKWSECFKSAGFKKDQVVLRELLWVSDICVGVLPPEYNIRYDKYLIGLSGKEASPKILHMKKFHDGDASSGGLFLGQSMFARGVVRVSSLSFRMVRYLRRVLLSKKWRGV